MWNNTKTLEAYLPHHLSSQSLKHPQGYGSTITLSTLQKIGDKTKANACTKRGKSRRQFFPSPSRQNNNNNNNNETPAVKVAGEPGDAPRALGLQVSECLGQNHIWNASSLMESQGNEADSPQPKVCVGYAVISEFLEGSLQIRIILLS